jgi:hypothetical protein
VNITQLKSKITKILKQNDFKKSEIIKEWNHPKHKCAGFEYWIGNDINFGLSYFCLMESLQKKSNRNL